MPRLAPYPSTRDSGLPWLGQIPAHWEVKRVKHLSECLDGKRIPLNAEERSFMKGEYPYWGANSIVDYIDKWLFDESLVLLGEDGAPFYDKSKQVAFFVSGKIWVNNHAHVLRPRKINGEFLAYALNIVDYQNYIDGSTRDKLTQAKMGNIALPYPPLPEQQTVVAFLDRQTAKIDTLITKKQRLLELLAEQRAALISQAVTKGLNPNVKMKDSGVAWFGQVPNHWEIVHLRRVVNKFVDYRGHTPQKVEDGIPLITARNIKNGKIEWELSQEYIPSELYSEWMVRGFPETGDVLVTTEAPLGETAQITDTHIALAQRIILLKADKTRITNDYLKYFLASSAGQGELWSRATGSTAIGIKASHLKEILIFVPPIEEQTAITNLIDRENGKIFQLIAKIETAIERLREYRSALISSAVTGKIKV